MSHLECSSKTPGGPFIVWGWGTPRLGDGWELGRTPFQTSSVKWGLHSRPWMHTENVRVVHSTRTPCNEAWRLGCSQTLLPLTPQLLLGGCEAEGTWYTFKCLLACLPHKNGQEAPRVWDLATLLTCQSLSLSEPWTLPVPPLRPPWSPPQPHSLNCS